MKSRYYSQSIPIYKKIQESNNVLINVHKSPDLDAVGSAAALAQALERMSFTYRQRSQSIGKKIKIISPGKVSEIYRFLKHAHKIETVDFSKFDYSAFDLFFILDSSSYDRVTGSKKIYLPTHLKTIIIDHHLTNNFGLNRGSRYRVFVDSSTQFLSNESLPAKTRTLESEKIAFDSSSLKSAKQTSPSFIILVDIKASATAEIIYKLFSDWGVAITKSMATALFAGIAGDTVFFKYAKNATMTFKIASNLLEKGADFNTLVKNMYNNYDFRFLKLLGKFLERMEYDKKGGFVWSAISYKDFVRFGHPEGVREAVADMFFQSVAGADFGMVMLEEEPGKLAVSFRSKRKFDVSGLAKKLGGGGHKNAAGCTLYGDFEKTVRKVIRFYGGGTAS